MILAIFKGCDVADFGGVKMENAFLATEFIKDNLQLSNIADCKALVIAKAKVCEVVAIAELGCCVVPIEKRDKMVVETNGEVAQAVAKLASDVYFAENGHVRKIK